MQWCRKNIFIVVNFFIKLHPCLAVHAATASEDVLLASQERSSSIFEISWLLIKNAERVTRR